MIALGQIRAGEALITLWDAETKATLPRRLPVFYKGCRQGKSRQTPAGYKTVKRRVLPSLLVNSSKYQPENRCVQILITSGSKSPLPRNTSIRFTQTLHFPSHTRSAWGSAQAKRCQMLHLLTLAMAFSPQN